MKQLSKKHILIYIVLCITFIIITVATAFISYNKGYNIGYNNGFEDNQPIAKDKTPIVYITPSGSKYHRKTCDYVNTNNIIEISTKQAKAKDYTACSHCIP